MEDTSIEITSGKRKRGRPRTYSTPKAKAAADVKRKRAARQDASHAQRNIVHTSFYQPVASLQAADASNGFHILADSTNIPPPEERDILQFLAAVNYQLEEGVEAQVTLDDGTPAGAADSSPTVDYIGPDLDEAIGFNAPLKPLLQPEDDKRGPVKRLAQKLAEQFTRFQGYCNHCHQIAKERADVLSSKTLAGRKDNLAGKVNAEYKDERVLRTAGVTFDIDSIIGFLSSLSVAKRGICWSPTRITMGYSVKSTGQCTNSDQVQHYPSSYNHSQYNSTARGIESLTQQIHPIAREQQLVYCLPPELLGEEKMNLQFEDYWTNAIDESHIAADLYIDIGKETCPRQASRVTPLNQPAAQEDNDLGEAEAETLLYKQCCLESYTSWAAGSLPDEESKKQVFYPFTMLRDSGSLTIETRKRSEQRSAGLLYSQFYPSVKEVFAAGNVYPFTNAAIETLALDKKLRKTWELVGGGLSHQPVADLLRAISRHIRSRELHDKHLTTPTEDNSPYYSFTTNTLL
ncbi:hypothetical protein Trco_007739 [Trichoderma cornu-damae]|uniref:Uncharacterized protein n=1 Tax=Trichoderma cornu-damae TaxID=654480 RepID=A0A9P8QJS3_9HYPO|nr:hypothetical protein Trco_007739 [Trichoderma cornu-damae]